MNRKIMKTDNFTHQTGIIDVDKHMMAYIERELKKRRTGANGSNEEVDVDGALASLDPNDELYKVAEKYRTKNKKPIDEGNVATSSAMLSAIPEIDLGIDNRLKNIEETERAKRKLLEAREKARAEGTADRSFGDANYANSRFFRHARAGPSEYETLKAAKIEAGLDDEGSADEEYSAEMEEYFKREGKKKQRQQQRTEMATDDVRSALWKLVCIAQADQEIWQCSRSSRSGLNAKACSTTDGDRIAQVAARCQGCVLLNAWSVEHASFR